MSFIASSELWGEEATARLCQIIVKANDGMAQQVIENRTDLLELLSVAELQRVDDMGLTLPYLAVHYDRPEILKYLHKRGIDLSKPCDPMEFGNAMFYAVNLRKLNVLYMLNSLGYSVNRPCDEFIKETPAFHAARIGDVDIQEAIALIQEKERKAVQLVQKNLRRHRYQKSYRAMKAAAIRIQKVFRGSQDRHMVKLVRSGHLVLEESTVMSSSQASATPSQSTIERHDISQTLDAGSSIISADVE